MRYFLDWRDYTKQPHIKQLLESKGLEFVRQQYIKEVNKVMWDDPIIINEAANTTNTPAAAAGAAGGGATRTITGSVAEVSSFTWANGVGFGVTGSFTSSLHGYYIEATGYNGLSDFSYNYVNTMKRFRFYIVSSSNAGFTATNLTGISGVITASYTDLAGSVNVTGSIINAWTNAIANQSATANVAGFTNSIAPSTLFTSSINAGSSSITITNKFAASAPNIGTNIPATTGSVAVITNGLDRFFDDSNTTYTFDATLNPWNGLIRK